MRNISIFLLSLFLAGSMACSDTNNTGKGGEQIQEPVLNSGPETEAERAMDQARDSVQVGKDSLADGTPR